MNTKIKRINSEFYEVYFDDKLVGDVSVIVASLNRPTGWWGYQAKDNERVFSFRAAHTAPKAAIVMLKRLKLWKEEKVQA